MRRQRYQHLTRESYWDAFSSLSRSWNQKCFPSVSHHYHHYFISCDIRNPWTLSLLQLRIRALVVCVCLLCEQLSRGAHTEQVCSENPETPKGKTSLQAKIPMSRKNTGESLNQLGGEWLWWTSCECSHLWIIQKNTAGTCWQKCNPASFSDVTQRKASLNICITMWH